MTDTTKLLDEAIGDFHTMRQWLEIAHEAPIKDILNNRPIEQSVKTILAALRFAKAMQPRPIEDVVPDDGYFLITDGHSIGKARHCAGGFLISASNDFVPRSKVTHIIPLPDQALKELEEALND